jgi:hypothetical protein
MLSRYARSTYVEVVQSRLGSVAAPTRTTNIGDVWLEYWLVPDDVQQVLPSCRLICYRANAPLRSASVDGPVKRYNILFFPLYSGKSDQLLYVA